MPLPILKLEIGGYTLDFYSARSSFHLCLLYMLGIEPETCGDRKVRGLPGRYSPVFQLPDLHWCTKKCDQLQKKSSVKKISLHNIKLYGFYLNMIHFILIFYNKYLFEV